MPAKRTTSTNKKHSPAQRTTKARRTPRQESAATLHLNAAAPAPTRASAGEVRLKLADYQPWTEFPVGRQGVGAVRFGIVGTGQAGGRIAKAFYDFGWHNVLAVNTAYHDLDGLQLPGSHKLLMDIGRQGAGKDMARGAEAAERYRQHFIAALERTFNAGVEHVLVAFGAGGGTGGGSAPVLIDTLRSAAKHLGITDPERRIGVIAAMPTQGEAASPKVAENATRALQQMTSLAHQGVISPLILLDNQRISKLTPGLTVSQFWPTVNRTLAGAFQTFNHLAAQPSEFTSFDTADYRGILESGGFHTMGVARIGNIDDRFAIAQAMKANLENSLLSDGFRLPTAKAVGAVVVGGRKLFESAPGLQERINYAFDVLTDLTGDAVVHRGIYEDDSDTLRVFTIVGGLDAPTKRFEQLRKAA